MRGRTLSLGKRGDKAEEQKNNLMLPRKMKKGDTGIEKQFDDLMVRMLALQSGVLTSLKKNSCRWESRARRASA
jgi:hypothetical protein